MIIVVHANPNAKITRCTGSSDARTFSIALHAPAKEGRANGELIAFLSKELGIPKSSIVILSGQSGKLKRVQIPDTALLSSLHA